MNIFIMLALLLANAIAITLIYQFVKKLPKINKIIFIAASFAIVYLLVSIVYWISGFGIEKNINEAAKDFIIFAFVPVNVIIFIPFIANKYNKLMLKKVEKENFIRTIVTVSIIAIIVLIIEGFYFRGMRNNIKQVNEMITKQTEQNKNNQKELSTNEIENTVINEIIDNEMTNSMKENEKVNDVSNNIIENKVTNNIANSIENNIIEN